MLGTDSAPGYLPRRMKTYVYTKTCTRRFTAALLTRAKRWKQPNVRGWMNGQVKGGLSVQWNVTHPYKVKSYTCYNVDETHVKKVRHKRPHTVGLLLYEMSRRGKSTETESRLEVTGG